MLSHIQMTAKAQSQRIEETKFLNKLTRENKMMDLEARMFETEERRTQILAQKV